MVKIGRLVRLLFGLQAWLVLIIPLYLFATLRLILKVRQSSPDVFSPEDQPLTIPALVAGAVVLMALKGAIGATSALAWWSLKKGWPSARVWALIASVACLPSGRFLTCVGLAGLAVFWKKEVVSGVADSAKASAPPPKIAGDGTHKFFDIVVEYGMLVALFVARYWWDKWGRLHGLPPSNISGWLLVGLAIHVGVVFHEAGHLLAGWSGDMVLRQFQIGPVAGQIRDGRWRFKLAASGLLGGGLVGMVPKHLDRINGRMVLMMAGGPVASLLIGSIATLMALTAYGSPWQSAWEFLSILGTLGLCDFIVNMTPRRPDSHYSDGAQIYQIISNGPWAVKHLAMAMVGSSSVTPLRPRDFDCAILEKAANSVREGLDGLHLSLFVAMHYLDSGQTELGIAAWRRALEQDPAAADKLAADSAAEIVFYEAAIAQDLERAHDWWKRVETKGDSRKHVDYWKGRTALLILEGKHDEAAAAFQQADSFARKLPEEPGVYTYDRWCVDILRSKLNTTDLERINRATADPVLTPEPQPA